MNSVNEKKSILHIGLASFFTYGLNYQDNHLTNQNLEDGYSVTYISNNYEYRNGVIVEVPTSDNIMPNGLRLIRVKYEHIFSDFVSRKIQKVNRIDEIIQSIKPDIIFIHGTSSVEIPRIAKYKKNNSSVKVFLDSHADYYTSGINFVSKKILHGVLYRVCIHKALKYIDKVFYVSVGCGEFLKEVYKVPESRMEFYSLGGVIPKEEEIEVDRKFVFDELKFEKDNIILIQAGKFDSQKKLVETLKAFSTNKSNIFRYVVIGNISEDIKEEFENCIKNDRRIIYLGWKNGKELNRYLNASDIYIQPGKVSAIAQNAICRSCAVILNDLKDYRPFVNKNGWLIENVSDIYEILKIVEGDTSMVFEMKTESRKIAIQKLDYSMLAQKIY